MNGPMQNVTPIDQLPDLEDLEGPRLMNGAMRPNMSRVPYAQDILPPKDAEHIYTKHIREGMNMQDMPPGAGMCQMPPNHTTPLPMHGEMMEPMGPQMQQQNTKEDYDGLHQGPEPKWSLPNGSPSCLDCMNHWESCPVCHQLFNTDKTIYIIAIILLTIVCLLLLKKVLDV